MQNNENEGGAEDLERMFANIFGPEAAARMIESMRAQGLDPAQLAASGMVPNNPLQMGATMAQLRAMLSGSNEPVNWEFAMQLAKSQVRTGDSAVTIAKARQVESYLQAADLWLDAVTDFVAPGAKRVAWSQTDWLEQTLPVWKQITEPVAANIARALGDVLGQQIEGLSESPIGGAGLLGDLLANPQRLISTMAAGLYGLQIGSALPQVAAGALTSSDGALPLVQEPVAALLAGNIDQLAQDLELEAADLYMYIAVREVARLRLFTAVPWLRSHLLGAIEKYASQIAIDERALTELAEQMQGMDPSQLQGMQPIELFSTEVTDAQKAAQEELETLLASIEGWVEVVTLRACAPHLENVAQMRELLRRRAIGGNRADDVLAKLVGMELRPKRAHLAAKLWSLVTQELGDAGRDNYWRHPDVVPQSADLQDPDHFLDRRAAEAAQDAALDAELESMLDGTLGWAEGLDPDQESEGDATQQ